MAYTAQQIAIIRSKAASRAASAGSASATVTRWKRPVRSGKTRVPFTPRPAEHFIFDDPVTIMFVTDQDYSAPVAHVFTESSQVVELFELSDVDGLREALDEYVVDGVVFATIDPYVVDVRGKRDLLMASSAAGLEIEYGKACDAI